ncbi:MAG: transketolase [Verrucomicrobiota bacterium]|nr:transketolase [Verrucomicrobiota bacterium]
MNSIEKKAIDTVRILSADAIEKAQSGHPGMPMGGADFAFTLWSKHLIHNPADPQWIGRDRFILSTGHGSMLLYSLLHLFDYGLSMEELAQFRQLGSLTPGHPEYGHTDGVEVTTGPLGSGFGTGVGMAIAAKQLAAKMNNTKLFNQKIYAIVGDGCMMEGCTSESASLAGHLGLDNFICFYDDNKITIEGSTELAFSEDVGARFKAYGWNTITINGHDTEEIENALNTAKKGNGKPTLIIGKTKIGKGSPNKEGKACAHGEPLGADELAATKRNLGFDENSDFKVDSEVYDYCKKTIKIQQDAAAEWESELEEFLADNTDKAEELVALQEKKIPDNLLDELLKILPENVASRASSGTYMQKISEMIPAFCGGAADLAPSTKTDIKKENSFSAEDYSGRNMHFGVREFAMGLACNGMALYNTTIPYGATFFVFSDYIKSAIRLAALQRLHVIYVFTHDSFFVGEDGPTHQPIEQLAMLRAIPGVTVIRPAEANEVAHAWDAALRADGPVILALTRQNLQNFSSENAGKIALAKGAYVLSEDKDYEVILVATGSEVNTSLSAAEILRKQGKKIRIVSMPSVELFENQDETYKESILPNECRKRVSIEAGVSFGWERYTGLDGLNISLNTFGKSGPYAVLQEEFGFTAEKIADKILQYLVS